MHLKDKVILITGSSQGIGAKTAVAFAKEGAKVVVTHYNHQKDALGVSKLCNTFNETLVLPLDVTDANSIKDCVEKVIDKFGGIDILVNNSGIIAWKDILEISEKEIDGLIDVNLKGLIKMTEAVLPVMQGQGEGIIINISSGAGKTAHATLSVYCATKFGVRGFTQTIAEELEGTGIRVYCVNPGTTATQMTNFKGVKPEKVADIIVNTAKENLRKKSGSDIDIEDYL